ncbi:maleate cis-trans isomerase family protein [Streptomyces geranii]|uniref:maleate cis-trans isomerase family protein n=1 Tax=Streptomyces geranii TaxID=2058923 RepID=UPI000D031425|nr:hypothetical protein [Streptomyces geranii]
MTAGAATEEASVSATDRRVGDSGPRIGILVIHNDPVPETELWTMAPPGVSVHTARFECPRPVDTEYVGSPARAFAADPEVARGLDHLGRLGADSIALCFGSSSFFGGPAFDAEFVAEAETHSHGTPVHTAAVAITAALRASGVRRPLVMMPPWFTPPTFEATERYLTAVGVERVRIAQFDLGAEWAGVAKYNAFDEGARWVVDAEEVRRQTLAAVEAVAEEMLEGVSEGDSIDGILVPGSGFRAQGAVVPLERELGLPVITANQAVLWYGLRLAAAGGADSALFGGSSEHGSLFGRGLAAANGG